MTQDIENQKLIDYIFTNNKTTNQIPVPQLLPKISQLTFNLDYHKLAQKSANKFVQYFVKPKAYTEFLSN